VEIVPQLLYVVRHECLCDVEGNFSVSSEMGREGEKSARENLGGASRIFDIPTLARQPRRYKGGAPVRRWVKRACSSWEAATSYIMSTRMAGVGMLSKHTLGLRNSSEWHASKFWPTIRPR
jgi:hypothetical protein